MNWTPALQSAVATVDSTAAVLAPQDAPVFAAATSGFDSGTSVLVAQAKAYLMNPSAGTLAQMQTQIVVLEQQVNAAVLQAARIVNPASQQQALAAIQAVATVVNAILGLIQSVSSKAAVAQMAAGATVKVAAVRSFVDGKREAEIVAAHYGEPVRVAQAQVEQVERAEIGAGF